LEHRFYRGSRAPARLIFDEYDEVVEYMKANANPGDLMHVWNYLALCRDDNVLAHGNIPDAAGRTPKSGAY
ncbi:MAG TPA: hypothetical protein VN154_09755, partial [Rhizomicrobium sp.]|nr:hypothetical protein [Rhizomicrobium sp.]